MGEEIGTDARLRAAERAGDAQRVAAELERAGMLAPETETTLSWRGESAGVRAGQTTRVGQTWVVIVRCGQARTRRLTEDDEDNGRGVEGDRITEQQVTYRGATQEEIAAEEARRAARADAKAAATPEGALKLWLAETGAVPVSPDREAEIGRMGLAWREVAAHRGQYGPLMTFAVAALPDGTPIGRTWQAGDVNYPTRVYEVVQQDEQVRRAAAEAAKERARIWQVVAESGLRQVYGWSGDYKAVIDSGPQTAEEQAAYEAGQAADARIAASDAMVERVLATGVARPEDALVLWPTWHHRYVNERARYGAPARLVQKAAREGRPVSAALEEIAAVLGATYPDQREWASVSQRYGLAARGLDRLGDYNGLTEEGLDALDNWADELGVGRVSAPLRERLRKRRDAARAAALKKLTPAQKKLYADAEAAGAEGLHVTARQRKSAETIAAAGVAKYDVETGVLRV